MTNEEITINFQPCESSQIAAWGYHPASSTLGIQFKGKEGPSTYHYADVPQSVVDDMGKAESVGKFFGAQIRGKFVYVKIEEKAKADEEGADRGSR